MANNILQQDITALLDSWIETERNGVEFPVPFQAAWMIAEYSNKANAKRELKSLKKGFHYSSKMMKRASRGASGVQSYEDINLSLDGFKHFCLMADTEAGDLVRQYFIESEKKWQLVQKVAPETAKEVEILHLQIELEKRKEACFVAEEGLIKTRDTIVRTVPKPIADRILGITVINETEYIDRTILPSGQVNDGVGITYIQKRHGFKSTKETWAVLKSIDCGEDSDIWKPQLRAVESKVVDRSILPDLDRLIHERAQRQMWAGEARTLFD